jgi:hypothetical protein
MIELTKEQIKAIGMEAVSALTKRDGMVIGYRMPKSAWKNENAKTLVWISCGNGTFQVEQVQKVWADQGQKYLEFFGLENTGAKVGV